MRGCSKVCESAHVDAPKRQCCTFQGVVHVGCEGPLSHVEPSYLHSMGAHGVGEPSSMPAAGLPQAGSDVGIKAASSDNGPNARQEA